MSIARQTSPSLTSDRLLASNGIWNLLGQFLPMMVAVVIMPALVNALGMVRLGVLSLAGIVIGYFGLFDLGIGRALTKMVADKVGAHEEPAIPPLVWTSLVLIFALGGIGSLALLVLSPWLVDRVLRVPSALQLETLHGFYLIALCVPFVTATSGLRGVLEGLQCFRTVNLIRIPMGIFSFAGPLLVLPFSRSLVWVIAVLTLGRLSGCLVHLVACFHALPALRHRVVLESSLLKQVAIFGGWMTISNVVNPILVYVDRFAVGAMASVSMIAFYAVPFDMVVRLTWIPGAIAGVFFPAFAMTMVQNPQRAEELLGRSLKYVFLLIFPITLIIVTLAPEILRLWLGTAFAENSTPVLRWLAAGVFVNSLAHAPCALIQSAGRPDLTAKLLLFELPPYLGAVWLLTKLLGIEGTAIAWTGRLALDAVLVALILERLLWRHRKFLPKLVTVIVAGLLLLGLGTLPSTLAMKVTFLGLVLTASVVTVWFLVLNPEERLFAAKRHGEALN